MADNRKELKDVEVGDRVWAGSSTIPCRSILRVARLMPKTMELDGAQGCYSRETGRAAIGNKDTLYTRVAKVATPEECDTWDADVAERKRRHEEREAARKRLEVKYSELRDLLPRSASVTDKPLELDGEWEITLCLSEEGVRRLAAWLAAPVS